VRRQRRTKHQQLILDHHEAALLERLSADTRVPKQAYLRAAVDLLLT
jgi:hypothetical protein